MPLPKEVAVKSILSPFADRIRRVIDTGFRQHRARGVNRFRRTDSTNVFDCVIQEAIREFGSDADVKIFETGATAKFLFKGKVLARFKKGDREGKGSNISTIANSDFLNPVILFPDAPQAMKVEICWRPNILGTKCDSVVVTARDSGRVLWSYELVAGAQNALPLPLPSRRSKIGGKRLVRLKTDKAKKNSVGKEG